MDETQEEQNQKIQEFLGREFRWEFLAGECNFLIQLLAFIVQNNPAFVINDKGEKEGSSGKWGGGDVVGTFRIPNLLPVRLSI